jgi:hypothetical protein
MANLRTPHGVPSSTPPFRLDVQSHDLLTKPPAAPVLPPPPTGTLAPTPRTLFTGAGRPP